MGEEPERLRADEALRKLRQSGANYLAFQGTQYGVWLSDDQCHALLAEVERLAGERAQEVIDRDRILNVLRKEEAWRKELQGEVERLAGERDGARLALESNAPLILDLTAEVERLAEELKEESRLVETAWRQRDEETEKAMRAEAECERLAGRVTALETALSFYADPDNYEATPRRVRPVIEDGGGAARALFLSSALDVGGPE